MGFMPFAVGVIAGAAQYGLIKYNLNEREDIVFYSVDQVKESFNGKPKTRGPDERYVPLRSREHKYYTAFRERWNSNILGFRDGVLELFKSK